MPGHLGPASGAIVASHEATSAKLGEFWDNVDLANIDGVHDAPLLKQLLFSARNELDRRASLIQELEAQVSSHKVRSLNSWCSDYDSNSP